MYWKFGTGDAGVAVRVKVGKGVSVGKSVGVGGTFVDVDVAAGVKDAMLGGAEVAQAVIERMKRIQKTDLYIDLFLLGSQRRA